MRHLLFQKSCKVVHNRIKSLKKATIENLLYAMGALYILNLYYKEQRIDIGRVYQSDHTFDNRVGSNIFSACYYNATTLSIQPHMGDHCIKSESEDKLDKAIYIIKFDDESFKKWHENICLDNTITKKRFDASPQISKFLDEHPEYIGKSIHEICIAAGGNSLVEQIECFNHTTTNNEKVRREAILNKQSQIYPELFPLSTQ